MHAEERELMGLLRQHATLLRIKKHNVYLLDNGIKFTLPQSPSCGRWAHNALENLRAILGIEREVHKNPNRRRKSPPPKALSRFDVPPYCKPDWKEQLRRIRL